MRRSPSTGVRPAGTTGGVTTGPRWFGPSRLPLFGWVHAPSTPGPSGAVVLCPGLAGEQVAAEPALRSLARDLAARGHWVVRFDYEGTGDAAGPTGGPGRVAAWLDSIDHAVALARSCTGGPVALVGMRMGALLAAMAATRRDHVDAVVLWDPCRSGRAFLRRHQAMQAMQFPSTAGGRWTELPGYALDEAVAAEVGALRLPTRLRAPRALVVARPGGQHPDVRLAPGAGRAAASGPTLAWAEPGEQEALLEAHHLRRRHPAVTSAAVASWLDETLRASGPGASPVDLPAEASAAAPAGTPLGRPWARMPVEDLPGAAVVERVRWFGDLGLFGVETEAAPPARRDDQPVVVLLSSGTDSHVGPSRLWVRLARTWAATAGVRCLRVDLSGWGESPPHPGRSEGVLRPVEAFDDVRAVLAGVGDPRRTMLVGLCSGAYQALESALEVPTAAVLAVNPLLRFTPPELEATGQVSPRRQFCDPKQPWVHSVRSRLPGPLVHLMATARSAVSRFRSAGRVEDRLADLVGEGVGVYCICGEEDARPLLQVRRRARAAWRSAGHVRVDVVPGLDHALLPRDQREEVCDRLTGELRRIVAGMPPADAAGAAGRAGATDLADVAMGAAPSAVVTG